MALHGTPKHRAAKKSPILKDKEKEKARVDAYMAEASRNVKKKTPPPKKPEPKGGFFSGLDRLKKAMGGR